MQWEQLEIYNDHGLTINSVINNTVELFAMQAFKVPGLVDASFVEI